MRGENADDVSVNRLQFFLGCDRTGAVDCIRREVGGHLTLRQNGRFVVFNVERAKAAAQGVGCNVRIVYTPQPSRPSHSSIVNLPLPTDLVNKVRVATAFLRLIGQADIYPAML